MREDLLKAVENELQEVQRRNEEISLGRRAEVSERYPEIRALLAERENLIHGTIRGKRCSGTDCRRTIWRLSMTARNARIRDMWVRLSGRDADA